MTDTVFREFSDTELDGLERLKAYASNWCREHQTALGVAEMALGAALLTAGWKNGALQMGVDFVAHKLNPGWAAELTGASGVGIGGLAGYIIGNIGVTAMGTGFAIPALALAGGAALVFGLAGYTGAKLLEDFLHQAPNMDQLLSAAGMVAVGAWLLVDGARRIPLVREAVAFARASSWLAWPRISLSTALQPLQRWSTKSSPRSCGSWSALALALRSPARQAWALSAR